MLGMRQQGALEEFKNSLLPTDTPGDIAMKWAQTTAGVPGTEQMAKSILPQYQMQAMMNMWNQPGMQQMQGENASPDANQVYEPGVIGKGLACMFANTPMGDNYPALSRGSIPKVASNQVQGGGVGGQMGAQRAGIPSNGIDPNAMRMSLMTGKPYDEIIASQAGLPQAAVGNKLQDLALAKSEGLAQYAQQKLPQMSGDDLNDFLRIGSKFQNQSPEEWFRSTKGEFDKFKNYVDALDSADYPGMVSGIIRGGKYREESLGRLHNLVKPLLDIGREDLVREKLVNNGLSPAEVEMVIRPLSKSGLQSLEKLPKAPYNEEDVLAPRWKDQITYDQIREKNPELIDKMNNKYADFFKKNINDKVSLLGLRNQLKIDKNMDWRQFNDALNMAQEEGLELTPQQLAELPHLTKAPRDSLGWIFQDLWRITDYLTGKK
jgi:hypothetical protein